MPCFGGIVMKHRYTIEVVIDSTTEQDAREVLEILLADDGTILSHKILEVKELED
jgi:hypothetical protein